MTRAEELTARYLRQQLLMQEVGSAEEGQARKIRIKEEVEKILPFAEVIIHQDRLIRLSDALIVTLATLLMLVSA